MITIFIALADLSTINADKPTVGGHIRIDGGKMPSDKASSGAPSPSESGTFADIAAFFLPVIQRPDGGWQVPSDVNLFYDKNVDKDINRDLLGLFGRHRIDIWVVWHELIEKINRSILADESQPLETIVYEDPEDEWSDPMRVHYDEAAVYCAGHPHGSLSKL